jgi:DnaJ-class molecular chaperone
MKEAIEKVLQGYDNKEVDSDQACKILLGLFTVSLDEQSEATVCQYCEGTGKDGHDRCDPPNWYTCEHCEGTGKL